MPRTALDLISASLKRLNVISGIETPTADLAKDSLERLNDLLETWRTEHLTIWAIESRTVPLISGHNPYLLGPGGDLTERPEWLEGVNVLHTGTPNWERPLTRYSDEAWEVKRQKTQSTTDATHYYYRPSWPQGELYVWPTMTAGTALSLVLYVPTPLNTLPTLTTEVDLPSGYFRALRDNLAIELAPELGVQVHGALQFSAADALAAIKRQNHRPRVLQMPAALTAHCAAHPFDWRTGE